MNDHGVVDIDEESHFLMSGQRGEIDSFELGRCSYVVFKFLALTDPFVVHVLETVTRISSVSRKIHTVTYTVQ